MKEYRGHQLGHEGRSFVDARLRAGNTLSGLVFKRHRDERERAQCVSWLPGDVAPEAITKFAEGGIAALEESRRWLVSVIQSYLASGPDRLVVMEDALARRGDPVLDRLQSTVRYHGDEVYRTLTVVSSNEFAINTTLAEAEAPHQLVCVFTCGSSPHASGSAEIEQPELESWADLASAVAVKAYDGEGYVFCSLVPGLNPS